MSNSISPWKLVSSTPALEEKWFPVRKDVVQLPSGKIIDDYFVWEAPHIVEIVAVNKDGRYVMVRQYRHALSSIMLQFPAGAVDTGETLEQAARRELEEETGYICGKLIHLGTVAPYATKMTGLADIFLAFDAVPDGQATEDEQEESEVCLMTADQIWQELESAKKPHMTGLLAAFLLAERYLQRSPKE